MGLSRSKSTNNTEDNKLLNVNDTVVTLSAYQNQIEATCLSDPRFPQY